MEEAVWGPVQEPKESTLQRVSDSSSISKTSRKRASPDMKTALRNTFNSLAVSGWLAAFMLIFDAFFNSGKLFSILLAGF